MCAALLLAGCSANKEEATTQPESKSSESKTNVADTTVEATGLGSKFYSTEKVVWGPGRADNHQRPTDPVTLQESYGDLGSQFIMSDDKFICLTFDEGYENGYTPAILDTLKEKQVKITFFVTMPFVEDNPDIILRMVSEGHAIGNHSVTHPAAGMFSLSIDEQINEVKTVHDCLLQKYGYEMDLFRYPQGTYSTRSLALMQQMGYRSVFWSFAYKDYDENDQPEPGYALQKLKDRVHPGAIYLLHVDSKTNADILGEFIDAVRGLGYELGTIR